MKERQKRKVLTLFLSVAMVFSMLFGIQLPAYAADLVEINLLHTNDVHGRFYRVDSNNEGMIGIDKIATIKAETDNAILVDAGDAIHGLPIVNINNGRNAIDMMAAAGYDIMTPGNHDFNFTGNRLVELAGIAAAGNMHIISSNIYDDAAGDYLLPQTWVIEPAGTGIKVGFFGLTTTSTAVTTNPPNVTDISFLAYKPSAEAAISALKLANVDIIVCVAHVGHDEIVNLLGELADKPDVVIEGHDHLLESLTVDGVLLAGAGEYQANLGKVTITFDKDTNTVVSKAATIITKADTAAVTSDPAVLALAEGIKADVLAEYSQVVAKSDVLLSSARGAYDSVSGVTTSYGVRNSEQPLGNLVADAMLAFGSGTMVAINNGGGLRADIKVGDLTKGDLNSVLPFGNVLVIKEATPQSLKETLEHALSFLPATNGCFPQISGMQVVYDPSQPVGSRVISISIGGSALDFSDTTTKIPMATNDFMANGGDGFTAIKNMPVLFELESMDVVLETYIKGLPGGTIGSAYAAPDGRLSLYEEPPVVVDKTALLAAIAEVKALNSSAYTAASWNALIVALNAAQTVADNAEATQEQVDAALAALSAAKSALVPAGNNNNNNNNNNNTNNNKPRPSTPATGDAAGVYGGAAALVLVSLGAACIEIERKKKSLAA